MLSNLPPRHHLVTQTQPPSFREIPDTTKLAIRVGHDLAAESRSGSKCTVGCRRGPRCWLIGWWWGQEKRKKTSRRLPLYVLNRYINMFFMIGVTWFLLRFLECSSKSTWYVVLVVARFPMSLNKASACFSVNTLNCAQGFFPRPFATKSRRGTAFVRGWYMFEQKCQTSHWSGMNWWDILAYLLSTLNSYLVFSIQYLCLVFCRQSWCLCVANMEKEKTIHPHRRRSSIFAGVFCSLEASGRE